MLDFITKKISKIFGTKSDRDLKEIQPILEKTLAEYSKLASISNDELRAKTAEFKKRISDNSKTEQNKIAELLKQAEADNSTDIDKKEETYKEIDELEKEIVKKNAAVLNELLPEAFAVVKETARRFKENSVLEVTATETDRKLAGKRKSIEIKGDKALWSNTWAAAGNTVTWDMVHYDVSLLAVLCCIRVKLLKWLLVKEKP